MGMYGQGDGGRRGQRDAGTRGDTWGWGEEVREQVLERGTE